MTGQNFVSKWFGPKFSEEGGSFDNRYFNNSFLLSFTCKGCLLVTGLIGVWVGSRYLHREVGFIKEKELSSKIVTQSKVFQNCFALVSREGGPLGKLTVSLPGNWPNQRHTVLRSKNDKKVRFTLHWVTGQVNLWVSLCSVHWEVGL